MIVSRQVLLMVIALVACCSPKKATELASELTDSLKAGGLVQDLRFQSVDGSKLLFKDGKSFDTKLFFLNYIGELTSDSGKPYFIFTGVNCDSCDANSSIYIHSPDDGDLVDDKYYGLPGKMTDWLGDSLIYEGRTFYGQVLKSKIGVIWYQRELNDKGVWVSSIFLYDLTHDMRKDTFLVDTGQLKETLMLMQNGLCKEIPGNVYSSAP